MTNQKDTFVFDVWRSMMLGHLIRYWGAPRFRSAATPKGGEYPIEIYTFPDMNGITKLATVGLSIQQPNNAQLPFAKELIMVLPSIEVTDEKRTTVVNYLMRIALHYMKHSHKNTFFLIPPSNKAPKSWVAKGVIIDEPRGEPADFAKLTFSKIEFLFRWVAPLTEDEYSRVTREGNVEFFKWVNANKIGLIDVTPTRKVAP